MIGERALSYLCSQKRKKDETDTATWTVDKLKMSSTFPKKPDKFQNLTWKIQKITYIFQKIT